VFQIFFLVDAKNRMSSKKTNTHFQRKCFNSSFIEDWNVEGVFDNLEGPHVT